VGGAAQSRAGREAAAVLGGAEIVGLLAAKPSCGRLDTRGCSVKDYPATKMDGSGLADEDSPRTEAEMVRRRETSQFRHDSGFSTCEEHMLDSWSLPDLFVDLR
jgi:hypothetical protein